MLIPKFTESYRQQLWEGARDSLYFYAKALCGFDRFDKSFHYDLFEKLDGRGDLGTDWKRLLIAMFRGALKTSTIIVYTTREALYNVNWSCRYIGSSYENAFTYFLEKAQNLFMLNDEKSEIMRWVYQDRIPTGFAGWDHSNISFLRTNASAPISISIKGVTSDQEGYHGNLIIIDDPEGAESEKSRVQQHEALQMVSRAVPLLIDPVQDRIIVVCTPHGNDPLAFRLLHEQLDPEKPATGGIEWDNTKRVWKQHWRPIVKADGTPAWPEKFGEEGIRVIRATTNPDVWAKQYLLLKTSRSGQWFNIPAMEKAMWRWAMPGKSIKYPAMVINVELWKKEGKLDIKWEEREVRLSEMFYYLHFDPKHKKHTTSYQRSNVRPSKAAIVVTAVSPDNHKFVLETWAEEVGIEDQLTQLYRMHMKYGARKLTTDPTGAQVWIRTMLEQGERSNPAYRFLEGGAMAGEKRKIPRLSAILEEDKKGEKVEKESLIWHRLEGEVTMGQLHLAAEGQDNLWNMVRVFPEGQGFIDELDALAQAPTVWSPPNPSERFKARRQQDQLLQQVRAKYTGYSSVLRQPPMKPVKSVHPAGDEPFVY